MSMKKLFCLFFTLLLFSTVSFALYAPKTTNKASPVMYQQVLPSSPEIIIADIASSETAKSYCIITMDYDFLLGIVDYWLPDLFPQEQLIIIVVIVNTNQNLMLKKCKSTWKLMEDWQSRPLTDFEYIRNT